MFCLVERVDKISFAKNLNQLTSLSFSVALCFSVTTVQVEEFLRVVEKY